jgi:uncharacterized membrane protein YvbJ
MFWTCGYCGAYNVQEFCSRCGRNQRGERSPNEPPRKMSKDEEIDDLKQQIEVERKLSFQKSWMVPAFIALIIFMCLLAKYCS